MEKTKEKCTITDEELNYIYSDILSIKVLAKNHGYFNSVLPEKYALGDWVDLKAGKNSAY